MIVSLNMQQFLQSSLPILCWSPFLLLYLPSRLPGDVYRACKIFVGECTLMFACLDTLPCKIHPVTKFLIGGLVVSFNLSLKCVFVVECQSM